ncbi:DUF1292 domain-containing protein [Paenibacillus sp. CC-CFT747]|nr:DUF1292 domain-containing protein [Paenibacillus sp. CC-CFT747]
MPEYRVSDVKPLDLLKHAYGEEVVLDTGKGDSKPFRILAEFALGERKYAVLQSEAMRKLDEIDVFHIGEDGSGRLLLETVEDDEEWESMAELYDEMTFSFDED